jgi:hypothetical protein
MMQLPAIRRPVLVWSYRTLWLVALLLIGAMPLVLVGRGDVWLGPAQFGDANRPTHSLIVVGGNVTVGSSIDYPLVVLVGDVIVDGPIHGDVLTVDGNVQLTDRALVDGDLVTIFGRVSRDPAALVRGTLGGEVQVGDAPVTRNQIEKVDLIRQVRVGLAFGLGLLLLCLVVATVLPWSVVVTAATARQFPIRSGLAAVTGGVALPLLLLPLVLSLVGLPIALVLGLGALLVWLIGLAAAGYLVGRWLLGTAGAYHGFFRQLIPGLGVVLLLLAVPLIGPIFVATIGVLGAGARIVSFVERERATDALATFQRR